MSTSGSNSMMTNLVNNKYRVTRRIGGGSFGEIFLGIGPSGEKVSHTWNCSGTKKRVGAIII